MSYYIKGDSKRGAEVIKLLESKGGKNKFDCTGDIDEYLYYTDKDNYIRESATLTSQLTVNNLCEELTLPKEKWNPKFKLGDKLQTVSSSIGIVDEIDYDNHGYHLENYGWWKEYNLKNIVNEKWIPQRGEKVLVKSSARGEWREAIFSFSIDKYYYTLGGMCWSICIPFDLNKLGKVTEN